MRDENIKGSRFNQRIHFPTASDSNVLQYCGRQSMIGLEGTEKSIVIGEGSRKHYKDWRESQVEQFRPIIKLIEHKDISSEYELKRAKKLVQSKNKGYSDTYVKPEMRHLPDAVDRKSEESLLPSVTWKTRGVVYDQFGISCKQKSSEELDLSSYMNRKQRPKYPEHARVSLAPDYSRGFFKSGGLVVGSTNKLNRNTRKREEVINEEAEAMYQLKLEKDKQKLRQKTTAADWELVRDLSV